jgi:CHAT domain-containing protein/tetratricopeptide (TPR) repeat protein
LKQARQSLKKALKTGRKFVKQAEPHGGVLKKVAYRSLARILHMSGIHEEALEAYLTARKMSRKDPLMRARIDRSLIDLYMYLGDFKKSQASARSALAIFKAHRLESDIAQTRVNYANVLHRRDQHREAKRYYREATTFFEKTDNKFAMARCYYNLANTLVQLFELDEAENYYKKAREIYEALGYDLDACDTRYGLAWLWMLTGRFHIALLELTACEKIYLEGGDPRGEALCTLDRAEVYLSLGLYRDALVAARESEKRFGRLKMNYEKTKASLFRGQAAYALGNVREAGNALERARLGFTKEKNNPFLGVSHLLAADIAEEDITGKSRELTRAQNCFRKSQLPLWEAVCELKASFIPELAPKALGKLARNRAVQHVPHLYAIWQTVNGDFKYRRGESDSARRYWQRAADCLDIVRAQLPPVELRTSFGKQQSSPHLRLIDFELERNPLVAAAWSERNKTSGVWSPLPEDESLISSRKKVEKKLAQLARQVAALSHQISGYAGERGFKAATSNQAISYLRSQVREEFINIEKSSRPGIASAEKLISDIRKISHQHPVIQFHVRENDIVAFVHSRGDTAVHRYRDGRLQLNTFLQRWRFILEGELLARFPGKIDTYRVEETLWTEIGKWLWLPLEISIGEKEVLVVPEGELANLPWQALMVDGESLLFRHRFVVTPSLRHYQASKKIGAKSRKSVIFKGSSDSLTCIEEEIAKVSAPAEGEVAYYDPARRADWPSNGEWLSWHYTGHAMLNAQNPFYSYLILEDGPLFAADFRLKRCLVNLVTLASCRTGEQVALPGEESTGLVRSLLEMGARTVISGHWPVADESTALWMETFYSSFYSNYNVLESARKASVKVRDKYPSAYHWAAFSISGAGDIGDQYVS